MAHTESPTPPAPDQNSNHEPRRRPEPSTRHNDRGTPAGMVVIWGAKRDRRARFASREDALSQGSKQRAGSEPFEIWDGADVGREGARPMLQVGQGQTVDEALQSQE